MVSCFRVSLASKPVRASGAPGAGACVGVGAAGADAGGAGGFGAGAGVAAVAGLGDSGLGNGTDTVTGTGTGAGTGIDTEAGVEAGARPGTDRANAGLPGTSTATAMGSVIPDPLVEFSIADR
jgi:hypothetical protein